MRKIFLVLGTTAVAIGGWYLIFYYQQINLGPALNPPPADIADIIENTPAGVQNSTGMPLKLPDGFSISIFAKGLEKPRVLAHDPFGNLIASIPAQGRVVALPDKNGGGSADEIVTVLDGLNKPHGLATSCLWGDYEQPPTCTLYVAEAHQLTSFSYHYDSATVTKESRRKLVDFPTGGHHTTRTLLFMPYPHEDILLISVGSSCNVCYEEDWRRAEILSYNIKTKEFKEFAEGLRNAVFMAIHPVTGKIWATEMGRDWLGDDLPPDEINIVEEGKNYGWPICYGKNIHDTNFDKNVYIRNPCMEPFEIPSRIDIPAHSSPLGLAFFPEEGWLEEYWHDLLVAYHGSWNRSEPTGYKIVRYKLDAQGNYEGEEDFMTGWLTGSDEALGRPVDILIQPGGLLYISDDKAGVIYRIRYRR